VRTTSRVMSIEKMQRNIHKQKGRPESRPLPSPLGTDERRKGFCDGLVFAVQSRAEGLQRGGCITMTSRINAVNPGAEFEAPRIEQKKRATEAAIREPNQHDVFIRDPNVLQAHHLLDCMNDRQANPWIGDL
jgi:hypothetical protein